MAEKKQRSLFWIISTIYLTAGLSGSIMAAIFVTVGTFVIIPVAPYIIGLLALLLLRLGGFLLGLRIGVNYVCDRAFAMKEDILKISIIVATIPIIFLLIFGKMRGFDIKNAIVLIDSLAVFFAARYFLGKQIFGDTPQEIGQIAKSSPLNRNIIIIALVGLLAIASGIIAWQYTSRPKEEAQKTEIMWKEYVLEKITEDFQSVDFMDRRLIGIKDDGERDVIVQSMKELMGWEKIPGEAGFYPVKVSFPQYSAKIFFVKYIAGTGHSAGLFMLDVNTLEFRKLTEVGLIYENYLNYLSIVSPDGFKIVSYGDSLLYLLDLLQDKSTILVKSRAGETFYLAEETPEFQWLNDDLIQYPVHSAQNIYASPEIRIISLIVIGETSKSVSTGEKNSYIKVISPNGGENYSSGDNISIEWLASGSKLIMLDIVDEEGLSNGKLKQFPVQNTGNYMFDLTHNLPSGQYKIRAFICPNKIGESCWRDIESLRSYGYDESDNYFSIESGPIITGISSQSGAIGDTIEIRGNDFSGFEGDLIAIFENNAGVTGIILGEAGSNNNLIKFKLPSSLCTKDTGYSGLPCPAYLNLTPGVYKIYATPWGKKSNEVDFTIK